MRVCDRGDPARAGPVRRARGVLARHAGDGRPAGGARLPHPVVPPDDQGLPVGGRRVHRHPRQLRSAARAGRRRRAAHRLRADRRGVGRGRQRRARRRPSRRLRPIKHWIAIGFVLFIAYGNLRGTKESGKMFARPDLLLHRQHVHAASASASCGMLTSSLGRRDRPTPRAWSRSARTTATAS